MKNYTVLYKDFNGIRAAWQIQAVSPEDAKGRWSSEFSSAEYDLISCHETNP